MKTMKWLIRRECWEHKGMLLTAPLVLSGILLALMLASVEKGTLSINGSVRLSPAMWLELYRQSGAPMQDAMMGAAVHIYMLVAAPLCAFTTIALYVYCLGSLSDERRDRSILFWKSLPVSDHATVLSKVVTALVVAPLIAIGLVVAMMFVHLLLFCAYHALHGVQFFGLIFGRPEVYGAVLSMVLLWPVYVLWALPTVAWLVLVSAWARSRALLWAIAIPALAGLVLNWAGRVAGAPLESSWYWTEVFARALLGLLPGIWFKLGPGDADLAGWAAMAADGDGHGVQALSPLVGYAWHSLAGPGVWIAALIAAGLIGAAIQLRRYRAV